MKAIKQVMKKDQEPYRVPKRVQDVIPIKCIWSDGIFLVGTRYSKTFRFTDINYMVASQEAQKKLFLAYAALINSLDCGATTKITLNNRHLNRKNFADTVLMKLKNDYLDYYRMEYNDVIMSKATGGKRNMGITGRQSLSSCWRIKEQQRTQYPHSSGATFMGILTPASPWPGNCCKSNAYRRSC